MGRDLLAEPIVWRVYAELFMPWPLVRQPAYNLART